MWEGSCREGKNVGGGGGCLARFASGEGKQIGEGEEMKTPRGCHFFKKKKNRRFVRRDTAEWLRLNNEERLS